MSQAANDSGLEAAQSFSRAADITSSSFDQATGEIEYVLATDAPVRAYRKYRGQTIPVLEVLNINGCTNLDRVGGTKLLDEHRTDSVRRTIGKQTSARVEGNKLIVRAKISSRPEIKELWPDIADGIIDKTSIGFTSKKSTVRKPVAGQPITIDIESWSLDHGALVCEPADVNCGIRSKDGNAPELAESEDLTAALAGDASGKRAKDTTGDTVMTDLEKALAALETSGTAFADAIKAVRSAAKPDAGETAEQKSAREKAEKDAADKAEKERKAREAGESGGDETDAEGRCKRSAADEKSIANLRLVLGSKSDPLFEALVDEGMPMAHIRARAIAASRGEVGEARQVKPPADAERPSGKRSKSTFSGSGYDGFANFGGKKAS